MLVFFTVKVKEQFELSLVEESVDSVRGGGSSNSNSPPTTNSSPDSPFHTPVTPVAPSMRHELAAIWRCYVHLMDEINNVTHTLGKDGKFQLFICLSLRLVLV